LKVLAFIKVIPIGTSGGSLSHYVAEVIKVLESRGVKYQLTSFGTGDELGSLNELTGLVNEVTERLRSMGIPRVLVDVSLDLRFDKEITLEHKVRAVYEKLGK